MFRKFIAFSFVLSLFSTVISAHDGHDFDNQTQDITVKTTKITDGVYLLQGRGGNVGVSAGADGILIVDDDYAQVSPKLAEALNALGASQPRFIFNTHWHGDHTEGNKFFGKNSLILAQTNVRRRLSTESTILGEKVQPYEKFALPVITYDQSISVHFNGDEIRAVHYPNGHTDGDSIIYFTKANVVHLGDHFFAGKFPFVDLENGGSVQGMARNVGEIIAKLPADVKIIPGHGNLSTLKDLKDYHQMLVETIDIVQKGKMSGKTLEGLKKEGLPEKYKSWGEGFINTGDWIETIYKSLSMKN